MHIRFRHLVTVALLLGAVYGGMRIEANRIQQTCEDDSGSTVINGAHYLCLSVRQIEMLRRQAQQGQPA